MSTQDTINRIEQRMASLKGQIAEIDARVAPVDAEIDALIEQEQAIQARIREATARLAEARGLPADEYLKLKRTFGQLAATRMQLRTTLDLIE